VAEEHARPFASLLAACVVEVSMSPAGLPTANAFQHAVHRWTDMPLEKKYELVVYASRLSFLAIALAVDSEGELWIPRGEQEQLQVKELRRNFETRFFRPFALTHRISRKQWTALRRELKTLCCKLARPGHLAGFVTIEDMLGELADLVTTPLEVEFLQTIGRSAQTVFLHSWQQEYPLVVAFLANRGLLPITTCAILLRLLAPYASDYSGALVKYLLDAEAVFGQRWSLVVQLDNVLRFSLDWLWMSSFILIAPGYGSVVEYRSFDSLMKVDWPPIHQPTPSVTSVSTPVLLISPDESNAEFNFAPNDLDKIEVAANRLMILQYSPDNDASKRWRSQLRTLHEPSILPFGKAVVDVTASVMQYLTEWVQLWLEWLDTLGNEKHPILQTWSSSVVKLGITPENRSRERVTRFSYVSKELLNEMGLQELMNELVSRGLIDVADSQELRDEVVEFVSYFLNIQIQPFALLLLLRFISPFVKLTRRYPRKSFEANKQELTNPFPVQVYICYSRENASEKRMLCEQLDSLQRCNMIKLLDDDRPGCDQVEEAKQAIHKAQVSILLITAKFLNEEFVRQTVKPCMRTRYKEGKLVIFPAYARYCVWEVDEWWEMPIWPEGKTPKPTWSGIDVNRTPQRRAKSKKEEDKPRPIWSGESLDAEVEKAKIEEKLAMLVRVIMQIVNKLME
jgi:hypothetical protein